jgi:hypothetical protein
VADKARLSLKIVARAEAVDGPLSLAWAQRGAQAHRTGAHLWRPALALR